MSCTSRKSAEGLSGPANYNSQAPWPRPFWMAPPCLSGPAPLSDRLGARPTSQLPRAARACPVWAQPRLWQRRGGAGCRVRSRRIEPRWASARAGAAAAGLRGRCGPRQTGILAACTPVSGRQGPGGKGGLAGQSWSARFWRGLRQGPPAPRARDVKGGEGRPCGARRPGSLFLSLSPGAVGLSLDPVTHGELAAGWGERRVLSPVTRRSGREGTQYSRGPRRHSAAPC